jgi:undecaprenyl-diphosphatase
MKPAYLGNTKEKSIKYRGAKLIKSYLILFTEKYGGISLLIFLFLEFLGLPVPGETLMAFMGYLTWKAHGSSLVLSIALVLVGTFLGAIFAYGVGHKYGENVLLKYGRYVSLTMEKLDRAESMINKNRAVLLIFSRFIPGVRPIVAYLSGISKIRFSEFLLYNLIGSAIWCTTFIGMGFVLGENWRVLENLAKGYIYIALLLLVFIFVVIRYFGKYRIMIFSIAFPVMIFIRLSEELIRNQLATFDQDIYGFLAGFISKDMTVVMKAFTFIGSSPTVIIIAVLSFIILRKSQRYFLYGHFIAANLGITWIFDEAFKLLFHRQRPNILRLAEASGFSFPSGHSMVSMSFYGLILYFVYINTENHFRKYTFTVLLGLMILFIGISRIYLGVHYASDVLAGFSAGFAWVAIFITLINKYFLQKRYIVPKK